MRGASNLIQSDILTFNRALPRGAKARAWAGAGHDLVIAKDGEGRKIAPLLAELGDRARLGTIREAAEFGEAVLFSVYWPRLDAIVSEAGDALDGKTVIETMNSLGVTAEFVHFHDLEFMLTTRRRNFCNGACPRPVLSRRSICWDRHCLRLQRGRTRP
ncbi:NAD(P)-binding domain-containing protein [Phyllobacterium sp. SB3]|uniref:NAD(P)-binding domain-containing protein n=1 Tax=Phyllobacterium sp. SB3 TaxID=3156073 RepID=UPI0032AE82BB